MASLTHAPVQLSCPRAVCGAPQWGSRHPGGLAGGAGLFAWKVSTLAAGSATVPCCAAAAAGIWGLRGGARLVRQRRAATAGDDGLQKQWEEFYEKDERDAREGWAIDIFDDDRLLKVIMTPSPRKTRVLRPMMGDEVTISYQWGLDGESSIESSDNFTFRVGSAVIRGLDEAVLTMSQGESSHFWIAPDLAYGDKGRDGVPPNASLEYEISLLKVVDMDPDVEDFDDGFEIPEDLDKMGKNDLGEGGKDEAGRYYWERCGQDMLVWIPISESTSSSEVDCLLLKNHINCKVSGEVFFDGSPGLEINEDDTYWEIEEDATGQRCVCIHLRKDHKFQRWPSSLLK